MLFHSRDLSSPSEESERNDEEEKKREKWRMRGM